MPIIGVFQFFVLNVLPKVVKNVELYGEPLYPTAGVVTRYCTVRNSYGVFRRTKVDTCSISQEDEGLQKVLRRSFIIVYVNRLFVRPMLEF